MISNSENSSVPLANEVNGKKRRVGKRGGCFFVVIGIVVLFILAIILFLQNKENSYNTLIATIEEANDSLPQDLGNGMVLKSASIDSGSCIYLIETSDEIWGTIDFNVAKKNLETKLVETMKSDIRNFYFIYLLLNNRLSLTYRYVNSNNLKKDIVLSRNDLYKLQGTYLKELW